MRIPARWIIALILPGCIGAAVRAQQPQFRDTPSSNTSSAGFTGTVGLTNLPQGAFQPDRVGIAPSTLFRNTRFPYEVGLSAPDATPTLHTDSVQATFRMGFPGLNGALPLFHSGFQPQDADLKIGPFYFKLRELDAAVLHSDNVNLTATDQQSGTIAITALTLDISAQITEGLQIATSGSFVFFPIEGKAGVSGFALTDLYEFGIATGPLAHAQISWDTQLGGWNVLFADDFEIDQGIYSDDIRNQSALFDGGGFDAESRAGRYVFRPPEESFHSNNSNDNQHQSIGFRTDTVVYSNLASATADRLLPGSIRLTTNVYREDLWYNQGNRGLPNVREGGSLRLSSERENLRFKPYFEYDTVNEGGDTGWQNIYRVGLTGPITDQLFLRLEAGYFNGGLANNGALWNIELDHLAGPYTQESIFYSREFSYFHDEIVEQIGYNLRQILGPRLEAEGYIDRAKVTDYFSDAQFDQTEWRLGLRLNYAAGPKTNVQLTGEYTSRDPGASEAWTGRLEIGYSFTNTVLLRFIYQYQQSTSLQADQNYTENLFFLSLTKYFE